MGSFLYHRQYPIHLMISLTIWQNRWSIASTISANPKSTKTKCGASCLGQRGAWDSIGAGSYTSYDRMCFCING